MATNADYMNAAYLVAFNRSPSPTEAASSLAVRNGGRDVTTFFGTFIDSNEFHTGPYYPHSIYSSSTESDSPSDFAAYITELYTLALGYVDSGGVTYGMASGYTAAQLMGIFIAGGLSGGRLAAPPAPTISGISVNNGPNTGSTITYIYGANFALVSQVYFGSTPATSFYVLGTTALYAYSPSGSGTVDITVVTPAGTSATSSADQFTYNTPTPVPVVSSFSPTTGSMNGGTVVYITGANFIGISAVYFAGNQASSFTLNSSTSITAISPAALGPQTATIVVSGSYGMGALAGFTYTSPPAPVTVTSVTVNNGLTSGGRGIYIQGTGFTGATQVYFGSTPATTFSVANDTFILATSPAGTVGTVNITVATPNGTSPTGYLDYFTYIAPPPTVSSVSYNSGPTTGGTFTYIFGTSFTGITQVYFGSVPATSFNAFSDTTMYAYAPAGSTGTVNVTVVTPAGTSAINSGDQFTYTTPAPIVSSISTNTGPTTGGTLTYIYGTNFTGATHVYFGSTAASFTALGDGVVSATSPAVSAGAVDIKVVTPVGTSATVSAEQFTYVTPVVAVTVTGVSPNNGPIAGGTSVAITGTGFTTVTAVTFGGISAASYTVNSTTSITAISPADSAGSVNIQVTAAGGTSSAVTADQFTYTSTAPTVTSVSYNSGPATGNTFTYIFGTNFTGAAQVYFGASPAISFTAFSDTAMYTYSPAHAIGVVNITVVTPAGTSATGSADQFTYNSQVPAVSGAGPNTGSTNGGTVVSISGTNFAGISAVYFGATLATAFTFYNSTALSATSPAISSAGTIDITVVGTYGTSATVTADHFTYALPSYINVSSVSPNTGPAAGGTMVAIMGSGFTGATAVLFSGIPGSEERR